MAGNPQWFVAHTYSGYEDKVKATIEKWVENQSLQEFILEVKVPREEVMEIKDGEKKLVLKKKFPGYVFVKMIMNEQTWFIIRNSRGVTGFVGPASKPVPLTEEEADNMGVESRHIDIKYSVGDNVRINEGPLEGFIGSVEEIDMDKKQVTVKVSMFGRETPVQLEFEKVEIAD